jgi:hypothetical protein
MKQTAVEWLVEQISYTTTRNEIISYHKDISKLVEQAKEMEKEQIMTAFTQGDIFGADFFDRVNITAEKYYKETYESNTCLLRDGCDGLMCYNCIKKQKEDESNTRI